MEAQVREYFDRYPDQEAFYENGGKLFLSMSAAESYGKTVTVTHVRGAACETVQDSGTDQGNDAPKDFRAMDYPQLVAECNALGIAPTDKKKETLIAALEAAQTGEHAS